MFLVQTLLLHIDILAYDTKCKLYFKKCFLIINNINTIRINLQSTSDKDVS